MARAPRPRPTPARAKGGRRATISPTPSSPPQPRSGPGQVLVEFLGDVGFWPGDVRSDVVLRGQILSMDRAESFAIADPSGRDLVSIEFGRDDDAERTSLPDGQTAWRTGFEISVPVPGGDQVGIADLWVHALARDGGRFLAALRLGHAGGRAALLAGPAGGTAQAPPGPPVRMYVEQARLTARGTLRVEGWAVAHAPVIAIQILAAGQRIGTAAHGLERKDIADAWPAFPNRGNAGFMLEETVPPAMAGIDAVTVTLLTRTGACHAVTVPLIRETPAAPVEADRSRLILLGCDRVAMPPDGPLRVDGWAFCQGGINRVAIEIDGRHEGDATYGIERPDVGNEHPGVPSAIGFQFEKPMPALGFGTHQIRVIASNAHGDEREETATLVVAPPERPEFRFELDKPATRDGVAADPVTGRLTIEGWALARDGLASIEIGLDGTVLGRANLGMSRPDVGGAFPDWDGAGRAGYNFHCPGRALPDGEHTIEVTARSETGGVHVHRFRVTIRKPDDPEMNVSIRRHVDRVETNTSLGILKQVAWHPAFHWVVLDQAARAGDPGRAKALDLTLRALAGQTWTHWRATILAANARQAKDIRAAITRAVPASAERFTVIDPASPAWRQPLAAGTETHFAAVLAVGDEPGRDALMAFALASATRRDADCLYADEFRLPPGATRPDAFFKPDFSPTLLRSSDYIGRPLIVRPALAAEAGATPETLARDGFHDLALRCTAHAGHVHHVAELLCRTDTGLVAAPKAPEAVITAALARAGTGGVVSPGLVEGSWRVRPAAPVAGKVAIIIPTCAAKDHIRTCLTTLRAVTAWPDYEIVVIDNIPDEDTDSKAFVRANADRVVTMPPPFNWSRFNNQAVAASDGDYLLFLNDDIEFEAPDWLDVLVEELSWPGVGIVGPRLLYPNRTVQHAGMFLGHGMGRHAFRHAEENDPGYFGLAHTRREVIAVTGACMLVRRQVFEDLGRFDETHDVINNDLDFCLRAHKAGLRAVYTPFATLIHHELASRAGLPEEFDTARFTGAWRGLFAAGDPYFNPRLSRHSDDYLVDDEGVRAKYPGHPLFDPAEIRAILVVKLDHLGDFITALPAIRRLKAEFPHARLTALVAPASASMAALEAAIDEAIPFEFFHARSELGEKELTEADLADLTARLAPYRFDLAVDLRKQTSTRHILRCSGAAILAGYDSLGAFPWLDIPLEWDGDVALRFKKRHISDDLLTLVSAIAVMGQADRHVLNPPPVPMRPEEMPEQARALFARPVVAIHPGSGNVMKQLPERHIAALIDLFLERGDVSVLLVGGADDRDKAAALAAGAAQPDWVASVAGEMRLLDLPRLLAACRLFIGGDSGPKHFAAAAGVASIGVHSGVVDPTEWGPMGPRAVALYRGMSCAPCFLSKPDHCPRALACIEMIDPALVYRQAESFLALPAPKAAVAEAAKPAKPARAARSRQQQAR